MSKPNIILIVSDTFRRDHLGAYGNREIHTPFLDRLAAESVVFDYNMVGSFPTMPARGDFLTSRFSYTYMGWDPLPQDVPTLPQLLSDAGYLTMGVVDVPFFVRGGFRYDRGFDDFIWVRGQGDVSRPYERLDARSTWTSEHDRMAPRTMAEAERWLERRHGHDDPFFLYVDTWDPHEPWDAPANYTALYEEGFDGGKVPWPRYGDWREAGMTEAEVRLAHAGYCGEITMVDRWIGWLLSKLDVLGLRDDTYVVFASDHGFYFGEHGYLGKGDWDEPEVDAGLTREQVEQNADFLETLTWSPLFQELTRVPLLVRGPGLIPTRTAAMTTAADIGPTILELAGVAPDSAMHGLSFAPVLQGEQAEHRDFVISSWPLNFAAGSLTAAIDSKMRRVQTSMPLTVSTRSHSLLLSGPDVPPRFHAIEEDPGEHRDVLDEQRDLAADLAQKALDYLEECGTAAEHLKPRHEAVDRYLQPVHS